MILERAIGARAKAKAREGFNSIEKFCGVIIIIKRGIVDRYRLYLGNLTNSAREKANASHHTSVSPVHLYQLMSENRLGADTN